VRVERHDTEYAQLEVARRAATPALRPLLGTALEGWAQCAGQPSRLREVPFPGVPLILNLGAAWNIEGPALGGGARHDSFLAGLHDGPTVVESARSWACIELRLTPLGAHRLIALPMHELTNRIVELEDVLPGALDLTDRLRELHDWSERFDEVEAFLAMRLALGTAPSPEIEWSWRELARTGGRIRIATLVEELGWSPRRLITRFREQIGLTPKAAAAVIRFDRAAGALRSPAPPSFASLAYGCGYADQAHLNRDFRRFAGTTPSTFLTSLTESGGVVAA
jgi:AraC-like DNA-binding protein